MTNLAAYAIRQATQKALSDTSDQILILSLSKEWPIKDALLQWAKSPELRLLVRRPFTPDQFADTAKLARDAGEATEWRNEKDQSFALIVLGVPDGKLDAGLKDVRTVGRQEVVEIWREGLRAELYKIEALNKPALGALVDCIFDDLSRGALGPAQVQHYIDQVVADGQLDSAQLNLWKIGYLPDPNIFDTGETKRKIARNRELMDIIHRSDDQTIDRRLREIARAGTERSAAAKKILQYRDDLDLQSLAGLTRAEVESVFSSSPTQPSRRTLDLPGLLNHLSNSRGTLAEVLSKLYEGWDVSEPITSLETTFANGVDVQSVRIELKPSVVDDGKSTKLKYSWSGSEPNEGVLSAQSADAEPEALDPGQTRYTIPDCRAHIESINDQDLAQALELYFEARLALKDYEPWLERDAFTLLLLNSTARTAVTNLCDAWADLAEAAVKLPLDKRPAAIPIIQSLETVQGHSGEDTTWLVLGCFHPFRLDPIRRVAEHVMALEPIEGIEHLGDAALWCLDRCYPAYPTIYFSQQAFYRSSHRDLVTYARDHGHSTPSLRDIAGLDGLLKAIEAYSGWMNDALSILVIDPPSGGGIAKALNNLLNRKGMSREVQVYHLATSKDADSLDDFNGNLTHLPPAKSLADVDHLPPVNIVVRFVAETTSAAETATTAWGATKGSHLALMISEEMEGGPFTKPTPKIKLNPRASNRTVKCAQEMVASLRSGVPSLATIRPLMQPDDASALSRIGGLADWVIFAAPGPLGLISPEQINSSLRFVGRATSGSYGLYAYGADNLFPVRRYFEDFFRDTPVPHLPADEVVKQLMTRAHDAGQAVLYAAARTVPSQIATLVAIKFAAEDVQEGDQAFVLSLDDFGWTRAWLGDGQRADFLVVRFEASGDVLFRVVESKSVIGGQEIKLAANEHPFDSALLQVDASLKSIQGITEAQNPTLEQDLRYASLIEHLMAAILSRADKLGAEERKRVFTIATELSCRSKKPRYDGMVVVTQTGVASPTKKLAHGDIQLIWAGSSETAKVFGAEPPPDAPQGPSTPSGDAPMPKPPLDGEGEGLPPNAIIVEPVAGSTNVPGKQVERVETEEVAELPTAAETIVATVDSALALRFIQASRVHGIPFTGDDPVYMRTGPTLFTFGVRMQEGAAIRPLEVRLPDIARDIGLGDQANQISVSNDTQPRTVRVSLPRKDRVFPELPAHSELLTEETAGYLPIFLGQTIDGQNWSSAIQSWPHLLVAGTTGSGKTTFMKSLLQQFDAYGASRLQVAIVDGKGDTDYLGILSTDMYPPEFPDVQLTHSCANDVLSWAEDQMESRRTLILEASKAGAGVKAADLYIDALQQGIEPPIKPLVIVIDEFADIMLASKKSAEDFEKRVQRITQVGRSRLLHLILATQRPDKETVRGAIKANLDARAVFRLPTQADSMTVLGQSGAEKLLKHGDMLFQHGSGLPIRLQAYSV